MRTLGELLDAENSAIQTVRQWARAAEHECEILPPSADRAQVLLQIQASTGTLLGALAYETGGVLIDAGWLRFPGSGHTRLTRDLASWNAGRSQGHTLVADDAVGGFFALNQGAFGPRTGEVFYWAPDCRNWESLGFSLPDFFEWSLSACLADFYQNLRWRDWKRDVAGLGGDRCFSFDPPLWTNTGSLKASRRRPLPAGDVYDQRTTLSGPG